MCRPRLILARGRRGNVYGTGAGVGQAHVQCSDARDLSAPLTWQRGDHSATQAQSLDSSPFLRTVDARRRRRAPHKIRKSKLYGITCIFFRVPRSAARRRRSSQAAVIKTLEALVVRVRDEAQEVVFYGADRRDLRRVAHDT